MRASIASILLNLDLPEAFKRKALYGIKLEKYGSQIKTLIDYDLGTKLGTVQYDGFKSNPCFYLNKELESSGNVISDLNNEMLSLRGIVQHILFSFWLIKDNAITSDFSISKTQDNSIAFNRTFVMFSNSKGEYGNTSYSDSEIIEACQWFESLMPNIIGREATVLDDKEVIDGGFFLLNSDKSYPYQNSNRLQRAIRFITLGRSESFLHAKITFYISALESLLSLSNTELRMQVADRTARIIGTNYEEKVSVNKTIGIAYSFRSSYIHGVANSERTLKKTLKSFETLESLSVELDSIMRQLIKRFLTDLNFVAQMKDEDFAIWINELLYR